MPVSVWISMILLTVITLVVAYYAVIMIRAFLKARREATSQTTPTERAAAFERHRAEAAAAASTAVKQGEDRAKRPPKGAPAGKTAVASAGKGGEAAAEADIEKALAELEGKVTKPSAGRIGSDSSQRPRGGEDVQRGPTGAPGDPGYRAPGGGA